MRGLGAILAALMALGVSSESLAAPPAEPAEAIVCRGTAGEGFSYEWGGECWCNTGCTPDLTNCSPGVCTPNPGSTGCPDCTHSGTYGADCSGFVSKAWQVPDPYALDACDVARYVASSFTSDHNYWDVVPMTSLQPADAVASSSHVILVIDYEDPFGEHEVVEAKGCVYGIVRQSRTFSSSYSGARRINLTDCVCGDGEQDTESCGDCGTRQRTCENDCIWSPWSPCEGPDPTGAEAACTPDGGEGECAIGQRLCVAGWLTCQAASATTEICDGLDNDCDGLVDNGTPGSLGEGYPCTTSCGAGVSQCIDGAVRCVGSDTCDATDPDGGGDGSGFGGCDCRTQAGPGSLPIVTFLVLFLAWRRRSRR
jgi:MYXO-CTERM domain-containing protein